MLNSNKKGKFELSEVDDDSNLHSSTKLINLTNLHKESHNNYEFFNIVFDNDDSITASENFSTAKGEKYVSQSLVIDILKEMVQQELVASRSA